MLLLRSGAKLRGAELVLAVQFDNLTLVKLLLRRGADVNQEDWEGRTPLQACLAAGNYRLVGTLLAAGAELKGGELYAAFRTGRHDVVNTLVGHGARFDDTGPGGESVLEAACSTINQTLMLWASRRGPSPYDSGALCAAVRTWIKNDRDYYLSQLLRGRELGRHEPLLEGTAVGMAAYSANKQILRCLLELPTTQTCLIPFSGYHGYQALFRGWDSNIKESYEREFWHDRSQIKCSVLVPALLGRDWGMVRTLLHAGYCPDTLSLLVAISQDRGPETIKVLITYGADVNGRLPWPDLESPLQAAVRLKRVKVVKTLLAHGAEVNAPPPLRVSAREWQRRDDPDQAMPRTALQAAVEHGHLPLIEMLLDAGADVNGPCAAESGATALQVAAAKGFLGIAKRLLELGADVNANRAATAGRTALEIAAEHGRLDMVQFLLENGASTQGGGLWQYHRAIGFAEVNGHRTIARLLKEWREWEPVDERCGVFPKLLSDDFWPVSPYSWDSDECVDEEEEEEEDDDEDEDWDNSTDNESTEDDG
jgi:ankyrin repeat protein